MKTFGSIEPKMAKNIRIGVYDNDELVGIVSFSIFKTLLDYAVSMLQNIAVKKVMAANCWSTR